MKTAFTPGPWYVDRTNDRRSRGYIRETQRMAGTDRHIAIAKINYSGRTWSEAEDNARLVAFAPDMFALLAESRENVGPEWRAQRDALLEKMK